MLLSCDEKFIKFKKILEHYIKKHFADIKKYASAVENRLSDERYTMERALEDNAQFLKLAIKYNVNYVLIDDEYKIDKIF